MKVRQRARTDDNHQEIVNAIRAAGASWQDTSRLAKALDGIIGYAGVDQRVEIKDGAKPLSKRKLTPDEQDTFDNWKGRTPVIISCVEDVPIVLNNMRKRSV